MRDDGDGFGSADSHLCVDFHDTDGANPYAELVQASNGYLYGTMWEDETVFKIAPSGALTSYPLTAGGSLRGPNPGH